MKPATSLFMCVMALPSCGAHRHSLALREVLECSKGQSNVTMQFYSKLIPPQGSAIITEGEAVWSSPMLLIGHYETPFSGNRYFIRLDKEAWLYHESVRDWVTAAEMGVPEIGLNW